MSFTIPPNETLGQKQRRFVKMLGALIDWAYQNGYELSEGEGKRTQQQAMWDAAHGSGIQHSNHIIQLAHDFNVYKNGVWLSDAKQYPDLCAYWKSLAPDACAGADWGDSDHFSIAYQGRK